MALRARVPKDHPDRPILGTLHVSVRGIPIGEIDFSISVAEPSVPKAMPRPQWMPLRFITNQQGMDDAARIDASKPSPVSTGSTKFERAFVSYSRRDFEMVSFFVHGLEENGMSPVIDVTALEPGDEWAKELPAKVESADVVYVMWSENAAKSRWVGIESRHAVKMHDTRKDRRPKIKPIPLHQPWPIPPEHLRRFHFDLKWQSHRTAQKLGLVHQPNEPPTT